MFTNCASDVEEYCAEARTKASASGKTAERGGWVEGLGEVAVARICSIKSAGDWAGAWAGVAAGSGAGHEG